MSDSEIREAVELADKIRRVPADKVTKTALAHLEDEAGTGANQERVRLDNRGANEDNEMESKGCGDKSGDAANKCGHDEATGGQQSAANQTGSGFSKMMETMKHCCPDNMKDLSSQMTGFDGGCCPSEEETGSKESV